MIKINYFLRYSPENGNFSLVHISLLVGTLGFSSFELTKAIRSNFKRPIKIFVIICKTLMIIDFVLLRNVLILALFSMNYIPYSKR